MTLSRLSPLFGLSLFLFVAGCGGGNGGGDEKKTAAVTPSDTKPTTDAVVAERNKLSPEDRAIVDAQEWCVISKDERLGSMGPPIKLDIKGEPVFVCCSSCKRRAEADPDKTLKTVAEHKAKKAAAKPQ